MKICHQFIGKLRYCDFGSSFSRLCLGDLKFGKQPGAKYNASLDNTHGILVSLFGFSLGSGIAAGGTDKL